MVAQLTNTVVVSLYTRDLFKTLGNSFVMVVQLITLVVSLYTSDLFVVQLITLVSLYKCDLLKTYVNYVMVGQLTLVVSL